MKKILLCIYTLLVMMSILTNTSGAYSTNSSTTYHAVTSEPRRINNVTFELSTETEKHINRHAAATGLTAAALGGLVTGAYFTSQKKRFDVPEVVPTTIVALITGTIGWLFDRSYQTRNCNEKKNENAINTLINKNNRAYIAHGAVRLDEHQRLALQQLLLNHPQAPESRSYLYQQILQLAGLVTSKNPIDRSCNYLKEKYVALNTELQAALAIETERPHLKGNITEQQEQLISNIIGQLKSNKDSIITYNKLLSATDVKRWGHYIESLPEHKADQLRVEFEGKMQALKHDEQMLCYELARLAALKGHLFARGTLAKIFGNRLEAQLNQYINPYPNTTEGKKAKEEALQRTKNSISSFVQTYQSKALAYSNQIITYKNYYGQIPQEIQAFLKQNEAHDDNLEGYQINQKLLEANKLLNYEDGTAIWHWLLSCLPNN